MKVYELMKALGKMPAGSEVRIKTLLPLAEVSDSILKDEIETDRDDTVILYAE